jgi:hypothetical protein
VIFECANRPGRFYIVTYPSAAAPPRLAPTRRGCDRGSPIAAPAPTALDLRKRRRPLAGPTAVGDRSVILLLSRFAQMLEEERNHVSVEFLVERRPVEAS